MQVMVLMVLVGLLVWRPVATSIAFLVVAQEVDPARFPGGALSLTLGHELYFGPIKPAPIVVLIVAAVAICAPVLLTRGRRSPSFGALRSSEFQATLALAAVAGVAGWYTGGSFLSAVNQEALPFLLIACGFLVGLTFHELLHEPRATAKAGVAAILGLAALGISAIASGRAGPIGGFNVLVFYDAALPAVAAAVVLGLLVYPQGRAGTFRVLMGFASLAIVIISLRRSVWVAALVVLIVVLIVTRGRGKLAGRLLLVAAVLMPVALLLPGVAASAASRIRDTLYVFSDVGAHDVATRGHVGDLQIGWMYVRTSPWWGIGPEHSTLSGLAAQGPGRIYVHNEWLLDWLRFGVLGAVLFTVIILILIKRAVVTLRAGDQVTLPETVAAMFVLLVPICCMTAPFISTTSRWPALLGIAAGLIAVHKKPLDGESLGNQKVTSASQPGPTLDDHSGLRETNWARGPAVTPDQGTLPALTVPDLGVGYEVPV